MGEIVKILYVDDDKKAGDAFCRLFENDADFAISVAESAAAGLEILAAEKDVRLVVPNFRIPEINGVEFLIQVSEKWPDTIRIVLAGYADTDSVVEAINKGTIYKFIPKPWQDNELRSAVRGILQHQELKKTECALEKEAANQK